MCYFVSSTDGDDDGDADADAAAAVNDDDDAAAAAAAAAVPATCRVVPGKLIDSVLHGHTRAAAVKRRWKASEQEASEREREREARSERGKDSATSARLRHRLTD